ncbi:MAG: nitroreductase [Bacteroidota bacterium]
MLIDLIKSRRAVFPVQYNSKAITKTELVQILEAGNWAPTHRRTEPWRFKVFYSEASRTGLSEFFGNTYHQTAVKYSEVKHRKIMEKPLQSGCVIAICMQRDPNESVPEWEEIAATAMAVQNMWLVAHDLKIGSYWSSPALKDHIKNHVPLSDGEKCLGFFYMGKYDQDLPEGHRNSTIDDKVLWL